MLERTKARIAFGVKDFVFRKADFQSFLDERDVLLWTHHMGFLPQWDEHQRFQLELAKSEGLKPDWKFLEIGCGPLTLGIPLMRYLNKSRYTGLDVRPEVLDIALTRVGKEGLSAQNPRLILTSSFGANELPVDERFDMAWSFSVLYHLTDELIDACFTQVARRLRPGGRYIANINTNIDESTWLQFPFNRRQPAFYADAAARHGLKTEDLGTIESLGFRLTSPEKENHLLRFSA